MITKRITYFGQPATHACDGRCDKAWGRQNRPRVGPPNDWAYRADYELGSPPTDPDAYGFEGGDSKPVNVTGTDDVNKWCVRECERAWLSAPGMPDSPPELPDFTTRLYNIRPYKRDGKAS